MLEELCQVHGGNLLAAVIVACIVPVEPGDRIAGCWAGPVVIDVGVCCIYDGRLYCVRPLLPKRPTVGGRLLPLGGVASGDDLIPRLVQSG